MDLTENGLNGQSEWKIVRGYHLYHLTPLHSVSLAYLVFGIAGIQICKALTF